MVFGIQSLQIHYLASSTGCLSGPDALMMSVKKEKKNILVVLCMQNETNQGYEKRSLV